MTDKCGIQTFYHLILSYKRNLVAEKDTVLKNSDNKVAYELNYGNNLDKAIADDSDRALIKRILELLEDGKAEEIVLIDAQHRSSLADYLLICEGRSQLHCRGIAENVEHNLKREGEASLGIEGEREGNWVLLDYGNIILHVFHPEIRKYYRLKELYEQRPGQNSTKMSMTSELFKVEKCQTKKNRNGWRNWRPPP